MDPGVSDRLPGHLYYRSRRVTLKYHRLLSGDHRHPPNSVSALRDLLDRGAEVIEFDVSATKDGFVILHDDELDRETTGSGPPAALTSDDIRGLRLRGSDEPPALLEDMTKILAAHHARLKVQVDLKEWMPVSEELARRFLDAIDPLRRNGNLSVVVGCLGDWNLRLLRRMDPALALGLDGAFYLDAVARGEIQRFPVRLNAFGYLDDHPLGFRRAMPAAAYLRDRLETLCRLVPGAVEIYLRKELVVQMLGDGVNPVDVVQDTMGDVGVDVWMVNAGDANVETDLMAVLDAGATQITTDTAVQLAALPVGYDLGGDTHGT